MAELPEREQAHLTFDTLCTLTKKLEAEQLAQRLSGVLLCNADNSVILFPMVNLHKEMKRLVNIN